MARGAPLVVVPVVVPVVVVPVPVDVDVDADAPDVTPEVEDAPPAPPVPEEAGEDDVPEQEVGDGVVDPDPDPAAAHPVLVVVVAAEPVVLAPVTGGILTGTLADEHTEVTTLETED